jgi:hypothetical protein
MNPCAQARATALCVVCFACSAHVDVGSTQDAGAISSLRDGGRGGSGFVEAGVGVIRSSGPPLAFLAAEARQR